MLSPWPVERPANWTVRLNSPLTAKELDRVRASLARGRPYGAHDWVIETVSQLGLQHTVRPEGRPRKASQVADELTNSCQVGARSAKASGRNSLTCRLVILGLIGIASLGEGRRSFQSSLVFLEQTRTHSAESVNNAKYFPDFFRLAAQEVATKKPENCKSCVNEILNSAHLVYRELRTPCPLNMSASGLTD